MGLSLSKRKKLMKYRLWSTMRGFDDLKNLSGNWVEHWTVSGRSQFVTVGKSNFADCHLCNVVATHWQTCYAARLYLVDKNSLNSLTLDIVWHKTKGYTLLHLAKRTLPILQKVIQRQDSTARRTGDLSSVFV
ncbi:hypothetical protein HAX54_020050 [Datura stramonium]|uniref:Uncharacterized protein n=1 Tax=Datura stramonium TaxID=4076 RepID=A0ABS8URH8_DATST|nr:hypothetical protein [Datura stramonium]